MDERPGRSSTIAAPLARAALAAALLALAVAAVDAPYQRSPLPLLAAAALVLAAALARPSAATVAAAFAAALLPVAGNLLAGPWVAPAELLLLLLAAAALLRHAETPASPLQRALAVSAAAMAAGGVAATLAALAPAELVPAVRELARAFFSPGEGHAALPLRAALVHAAGLLGFLLFRRTGRERGRTLLLALVGGLALVGAYAIVEASAGLKLWGAALYEVYSHGLRVPSTLPDYNATGAAMALALFPALVLAREARGARRLALAGCAALLLAGLLLSGSRGAWLATLAAAGAALAGALRARPGEPRRERRRVALGAALALGVALGALAAWPGEVGALLRRRAATLVDPGASLDAVKAGRVGFWRAGVRMAVAHPLAGVGPGRVPARFAEFRDPGFPVAAENVHNYFLQAVAENGVPGGLLVLWPFVPLALLAGRLLLAGDAFSSPSAALAPGLLAFALTGFASHPWLLPEMQFLFWGAAALLPAPTEEEGPPAARGTRHLLPWALLAAWAAARLLSAPGSERGRFGWGEWGASGSSRYFWVGPHALVPVDLPGGGAVRVRIRGMLPDVEEQPYHASIRLDGGPARTVSFEDQAWQDVVVERGPLRQGGDAGGGERGLLRIDSRRAFCPARDGEADRRVLSMQLARPPVTPAGATPP
ncbi:MAG: O-antigen ligase family protein [Thermoanaerobaculia bacterium]